MLALMLLSILLTGIRNVNVLKRFCTHKYVIVGNIYPEAAKLVENGADGKR
jgi:hypothetical protein